MALTEEQKSVWLSEDFHRIVIADIYQHDGNILKVEHFSSFPYVMPIDDTTDVSDVTNANNLNNYPIDFDNSAGWTLSNVVVNPNTWVAPDGTLTADKIAATAVAAQHAIHLQYTEALNTGIGTHTFSVYVKAAGVDHVLLLFWNPTDSSRGVTQFNLITGQVDSGSGTIKHVGSEWYLLSITATSTTEFEYHHIFPTDAAYNTDYVGDGVSGIAIWGAMLVPGTINPGYQTLAKNLVYDDIISNVPNIVSRIDQDSTVGAISLLNTDGEYDYLLNDVTLTGHPIQLFIGDSGWPRDNFIPILDGIVNSVSSSSPENITISLRDRKETLNIQLQSELFTQTMTTADWDLLTPTEQDATNENWHKLMDQVTFVGDVQGTRPYSRTLAVLPEDIKNTHVPICLGKCFNIEPVLIDSWNHIYMIHTSGDATIDSLVSVDEIRSNGIPLEILIRELTYLPGTGTIGIGDIIIDDTNPLIWGTVYDLIDVDGIDHDTIRYVVNDPLYDFGKTGSFTSSSGATGATLLYDSIILDQYEIDLSLGLIRLLDHPSGTQITCDVTAQDGRSSLAVGWTEDLVAYSAAWIIEWILLEKAGLPFSDLCQYTFPPTALPPPGYTNSKGFDNTSAMGVYYKEEQTLLTVVTNIINSVGGFIRFKDDACKMQLYKLIDPAGVPDTDIDLYLENDDIIENGISIAAIEEPKKSITLGYRKNWKTQDEGSLAGALADISVTPNGLDLIDSFKKEYTSLYELTGISETEYPLAEDIDLISTSIYEVSDAQTELDRRIGLRTPRRRIIRINSLATSFTYDTGDIVHITHPRFGLQIGKKAIIVGIEESPTSKRVNLDVWL